MAESYTELDTAFTTADTVGPVEISFAGGQLDLGFSVYASPNQRVVFFDVRAFSWTGWEGSSSDISPDRVYLVSGSSLLAPYESFAVGGIRFKHFKLGFNAEAKYLDVIATRMEEKKPNQAPEPTRASVRSVVQSHRSRGSA